LVAAGLLGILHVVFQLEPPLVPLSLLLDLPLPGDHLHDHSPHLQEVLQALLFFLIEASPARTFSPSRYPLLPQVPGEGLPPLPFNPAILPMAQQAEQPTVTVDFLRPS
jgi:hypothetical protein